jgi:hypothetical protein
VREAQARFWFGHDLRGAKRRQAAALQSFTSVFRG